MSYITNPTSGGVAGMFEYANAVAMGIDRANTYHPFWTSGVQASGANKNYHFEPLQNATNIDKDSAAQLMNSTGPQACSGSAFIVVSAGDVFLMLCSNQTDTTGITIVNMNFRLKRYAQ
jgi:hypothetical protein